MAGEDDGREAVRRYVRARMAEVRPAMTREALASRADISRDTIGDFLNGRTWPQPAKLDAIEQALGMTAGTLDAVRRGDTPEVEITRSDDSVPAGGGGDDLIVTFDADAVRDLSPTEREELLATARAAGLRLLREIKGG